MNGHDGDHGDDSGETARVLVSKRNTPSGRHPPIEDHERTPNELDDLLAENAQLRAALEAVHSPPPDSWEEERTDSHIDPLARLLARTKRMSREQRQTSSLLRALVLSREAELERKAEEAREEGAREEREIDARRKMRQSLMLSLLGIVVPTLAAVAALIAALHGAAPSSPVPSTTITLPLPAEPPPR